ncbi:hypothetical protein DPMN_165441 [Dreissena polymorpha]|uniref:Uncharacterized protein n=1 Tax=Dreissena polymorpha TaxID=45954 RepID=A0A9D4F0A2_DREPO|nr:hypothetical protein DPMN_165441 [Dreissena polymorpha]
MIPERNLMEACALGHEQQLSWRATLNEMMTESPRIILRLPEIRQALIAHPEPLRWYSGRKIEREMIRLIIMNRRAMGMDFETDVTLRAIRKRQGEIIYMYEVCLRMIMEGGRVTPDV